MSSGLTGATYGEMCPAFPASYYRARYYDSLVGRFLTEDPLRFFSGEVNFYGYVEQDPLNLTDPLGLSCHCTYSQATGHLKCVDNATGKVVAEGNGYAGYGHGKNDPDMQNVPFVGPLPRGDYRMGPTLDRKKTGPMTIMLMYIGGSEPFPANRDKDMFRIHGGWRTRSEPPKRAESQRWVAYAFGF